MGCGGEVTGGGVILTLNYGFKRPNPLARAGPPRALLLALSLLTASAVSAQPGGALPGPLPLFPADNWWNADVSAAPVDSRSASYINFIGAGVGLHPDFGGDCGSVRPRSTG